MRGAPALAAAAAFVINCHYRWDASPTVPDNPFARGKKELVATKGIARRC
jgi:hypothetical protein